MAGEAGEEIRVSPAYLRYLWTQVTQSWAKRAKPPHPIPDDALRLIAQMMGRRDLATVLCLGARNRREPDFWRSEGYSNVTAVDLLPSRGVRFGDMHRLPFDNGTFDLVIASHVLEHAYSPGAAIAEICRVLKPRGLLWAAWPRGFIPTDHDRVDYGSASAFRSYVEKIQDRRIELIWREDAATESRALLRIR